MNRLFIITAVTREKHLPRLEKSLESLVPYFQVEWVRQYDLAKAMKIGACWNEAVSRIRGDGWIHFVDDDNEVHPNFGELLIEVDGDTDVVICKQFFADGSPRHIPTRMVSGKVDIAQIVVKLHVAHQIPFQRDNSFDPDGQWAEDIVEKGFVPLFTDIPTWYNKNAGRP